jgi:iron complex transport system ATP-binding protein
MLHVDHISVRAGRRGPRLLRDISFSVMPGSFLAVLGPNGSGKSTLLRAVGGELPLAQGSVRWKGLSMADHGLRRLAEERVLLDQHAEVPFGATAREVVMMGRYPHFSGAPRESDVRAVDMAMDRMGLEPYEKRPITTFSGGERQRVHIARALAQLGTERDEPALLLLDEPLNNLDIRYQDVLMRIAREQAQAGHCVMAVLHDVELAARHADHVMLLQGGRVLDQGTPLQVLTAPALEQLYGTPATVDRHPRNGELIIRFGEALRTDASMEVGRTDRTKLEPTWN